MTKGSPINTPRDKTRIKNGSLLSRIWRDSRFVKPLQGYEGGTNKNYFLTHLCRGADVILRGRNGGVVRHVGEGLVA